MFSSIKFICIQLMNIKYQTIVTKCAETSIRNARHRNMRKGFVKMRLNRPSVENIRAAQTILNSQEKVGILTKVGMTSLWRFEKKS